MCNKYVEQRCIEEANYILATEKNIREVAEVFGLSKTTIHRDLKYKLKEIDAELHKYVTTLLELHSYLGQLKGGESTRRLWKDAATSNN